MAIVKIKCEICGQEISKSNYSKHLRRHNNHPETFKDYSYKLNHDGLICQFCGKECKNRNSLCNHERLCKNNPNRQESPFTKWNMSIEKRCWNKGLTKETDERIAKAALKKSNTMKGRPGRKHTKEEKLKISNSRKKYLSEHPDKVPYLINHSSNMSYPEKYFKELFEKESIDLQYHYQLGKYELDFANLQLKIDIEIDGEQHFLDERIARSDADRNDFLLGNGWKVFRIRWADYKKLSLEEKQEVIKHIKELF